MLQRILLPLVVAAIVSGGSASAQRPNDVPVTIKEIDVPGAIREFKAFQDTLVQFREQIGEGRQIANETSQILEDLRNSASFQNNYNETPILETISTYVTGVLSKQVELVDFLESQRYRISYYANKMASSVQPQDLAIIFGTEEQNSKAIETRVKSLDGAQQRIAEFIDALPPGQFDRETFRPSRAMPAEARQQMNNLLYGYQQERNALELAKQRLKLVRSAQRSGGGAAASVDLDTDLLVGQMFGALDRIRLQMSMDLMYLEQVLSGYSRSSSTQEILQAFTELVEMQGVLEGPSPDLPAIFNWLEDESLRRINDVTSGLQNRGLEVPQAPELLKEAYMNAKGAELGTSPRRQTK